MPTSTTPIDYVFVYGTLLMASKHPMAAHLRQHCQLVGPGYFPGRLYNLGLYPGAVYDSEASQAVYGEIYRMNNPDDLLSALDHYEGLNETRPEAVAQPDEYVRELVPVQTESGLAVCWTYLYNLPTDKLPQLTTGRYFINDFS